ncbi:hypothetical protein ABXS69_07935 [Actinomyces timonensis]|uniref:Uncharacterized protein n=1 Tax=Actinomyces timonensis TaxID=1288391 RepID=A0AAU8N320_9ACTO
MSQREFAKRQTTDVGATPECDRMTPRGDDGKQKTARTRNRALGEEPLAIEYDLTD